LPATIEMAEETAFKNGRIYNFQEIVTLTLDRVILHTIVHHSLTSTYMPNLIEIEATFWGRMDIHACVWTFETHFIRLTHKSQANKIITKKLKPGLVTSYDLQPGNGIGK